ncbi:MAG: gamma-glutamylcyclotransferase family protein [Bacteroidota bacterium]
MEHKLFVYGSLRSDFESRIGKQLKLFGNKLGVGYAAGRIFDLGMYPGFVPGGSEKVEGDVIEIFENQEAILKDLDEFEGISTPLKTTDEYKRELIKVDIKGNIHECWVYVYQGDTTNLKHVRSGNYLDYIKDSPPHWGFINSI